MRKASTFFYLDNYGIPIESMCLQLDPKSERCEKDHSLVIVCRREKNKWIEKFQKIHCLNPFIWTQHFELERGTKK